MNFKCEISTGEFIDKLTILEIKLENIKNEDKNKEVKKEYDCIIKYYKSNSQLDFYYKLLKNINLDIWNSMDKLRLLDVNKNKEEWVNECLKTIKDNDRRFRVKNKINYYVNSNLKEQKGYALKKALFLYHLSLGDSINMIPIVRYLSTIYDEVHILAIQKNYENIKTFYSDDPSIKIIKTNNYWWNNSIFYNNIDFTKYNKEDIFISGIHRKFLLKLSETSYKNLPFEFYDEINMPHSLFYNYSYIPENTKSKDLYNYLLDNNINEYIFMHGESSNGKLFDSKKIEQINKINKNNILIINPCYNEYVSTDKFYNIAQYFLNHKILDYTETIINASELFFTNSSFFCLSLYLPLKNKKIYVNDRGFFMNEVTKHLQNFEILKI